MADIEVMPSHLAAREHISGDRIPCLICGKLFRSVCHHAALAHGISGRDYKLRFGLPVSKGVSAPDSRAAWRDSIVKTRSAGKIIGGNLPPVEFRKPRQMPLYASMDMRRIDPAEIETVLLHVGAGCTLTEACHKPGAPRWTWLHAQLERDQVLQQRFEAVIEALPFGQQARMKKLGRRFSAAVAELKGKTGLAVGIALGVSEEAARREINRQKKPGYSGRLPTGSKPTNIP